MVLLIGPGLLGARSLSHGLYVSRRTRTAPPSRLVGVLTRSGAAVFVVTQGKAGAVSTPEAGGVQDVAGPPAPGQASAQ
jgi:hypothetical protein